MTEGARVAHAFAALCRDELGLDPAQLIAGIGVPFADLYDYFAAFPADEQAVEEAEAELAASWRRTEHAYPAT
jgi:hypothetical protein